MSDDVPAIDRMSPAEALRVAVRELRRRRQSIQRRRLPARDPRWAVTFAELAAAISVLEALARSIDPPA